MAWLVTNAFSDRTGAPIVTHISETKREVDDSLKAKGASPVDYLSRIGFLNNRVIAAHMVWPNDGEIEILKRLGVGVVHNPQSNMKLASGVAPVAKMMMAGVRVGLGTDGAASNNDLSMWEEMDTAAKLQKVFSGDPKLMSAPIPAPTIGVTALVVAVIFGTDNVCVPVV